MSAYLYFSNNLKDTKDHVYAILKALYCFMVKRAHKARDNQFFFKNVQNQIFKIIKMFKDNMKLTRVVS